MGGTNRDENKFKTYRREVRRASQLTPPAADGLAASNVFRRIAAGRQGRRAVPNRLGTCSAVHVSWRRPLQAGAATIEPPAQYRRPACRCIVRRRVS